MILTCRLLHLWCFLGFIFMMLSFLFVYIAHYISNYYLLFVSYGVLCPDYYLLLISMAHCIQSFALCSSLWRILSGKYCILFISVAYCIQSIASFMRNSSGNIAAYSSLCRVVYGTLHFVHLCGVLYTHNCLFVDLCGGVFYPEYFLMFISIVEWVTD